jgi:hypothetical protein
MRNLILAVSVSALMAPATSAEAVLYSELFDRASNDSLGGTILHFAHRGSHASARLADSAVSWPRLLPFLVLTGARSVQALVKKSRKNSAGTVRLRFYNGNITTAVRQLPVTHNNPCAARLRPTGVLERSRVGMRLVACELALTFLVRSG